ncbi:MAG: ribosomal protein S18-alanine N-acetyltransferase [Gemmatimonadetes bacterium]|nr:ribosomal protein S18-alanine N-acetyltransferase [Gemmatimonadota bacterium]
MSDNVRGPAASGGAPSPAAARGVRVRGATPADVGAVHAIEVASFGDPWPRNAFVALVGEPRVYFPVAELAGAVAGYAMLVVAADEGEITNIAVAPAARRDGIGAILLDRLIDEAARRGARTLYLDVRESNAGARALYASRGFAEAGRRRRYYSAPVEDALSLRLALPAGGD